MVLYIFAQLLIDVFLFYFDDSFALNPIMHFYKGNLYNSENNRQLATIIYLNKTINKNNQRSYPEHLE